MVALALTVGGARDQILKRCNALDSTEYQTMVLEELNNALIFVSTQHDWEYMREFVTITMPDATGIVTLPQGVDRIMSLHISGNDESIIKKEPLDFDLIKEDTDLEYPTFYCVHGYAQDTSILPPRIEIEIYIAPASGASVRLWFLKEIDEIESGDLDTVPNLPPHIWNLIIKKATLEMLVNIDASARTIAIAERHFLGTLETYKRRESFGSSKYESIKQRGDVANYFKTRMTQ